MEVAHALELCRFLHDAAAMSMWGAFAYLATLVPRGSARDIGRQLEGFRRGGIIVVIATAAAALPVKAALIGNGWGDAVNPAVLRPLLFATHVGRAWMGDAAASALLAATLFAPPRLRAPGTAAASGLVLATLALTGHAVMHEGWLGRLHRATDLVHVLASGGWFGALPVLALILKRGDGAGGWADVKTVLTRFSAAGLVAVALMILTGILNTALVLGRWPVDWSSPYQALLAAKVALVLLMIGVAGLNRYGHTRRFDRDPAATAFAIRRGAMGEIALGAGVIGLVAVLGVLRPV